MNDPFERYMPFGYRSPFNPFAFGTFNPSTADSSAVRFEEVTDQIVTEVENALLEALHRVAADHPDWALTFNLTKITESELDSAASAADQPEPPRPQAFDIVELMRRVDEAFKQAFLDKIENDPYLGDFFDFDANGPETATPADDRPWLEIAAEVTGSEGRRRDYGRPLPNFLRMAMSWTIEDAAILKPGAVHTPLTVARKCIRTKLDRDVNTFKVDNFIDTMGYSATVDDMDRQMRELGYTGVGVFSTDTWTMGDLYNLLMRCIS